MNFTTAVKTCLRKYFVFSGRASRSEFWWFYLFTVVLGAVGGFIDGILAGSGVIPLLAGMGIFGGLASLFTIIPSLAAATRRLHDTGRSGWWLVCFWILIVVMIFLATAVGATESAASGVLLIISLLAVIGLSITMLVFYCLDSQDGPNKYGPHPLHETNEIGVFD